MEYSVGDLVVFTYQNKQIIGKIGSVNINNPDGYYIKDLIKDVGGYYFRYSEDLIPYTGFTKDLYEV